MPIVLTSTEDFMIYWLAVRRAVVSLCICCFVPGVFADPGDGRWDSLRIAADKALTEGRSGDAISMLRQVDKRGEGADYVRLGRAYLAAGDGKRAKNAFQRAIQHGAEAEGYNGMGLVYMNTRGRGMLALYNFRRALGEDPTLAEAQYHIARVYETLRPLDALSAFEQAVALDARHPDAHYRIGRLLEEAGDRNEAVMAYRRQLVVNHTHGGARYRLGKQLFLQGQRREAARIFGELTSVEGEEEPRAYMEMAILSQVAGDFENAQRFFETYIASLPEEEQRLYRDISLVATQEELTLYRHAMDDQKGDLIRRFWNRHDPAPLTAANERLVEHYRRVAYARENYARDTFPWDDRGKVYIRFGPPNHISSSDDMQAELDPYIQDARLEFVNRLRLGLSVRPGYPIFPVREDARWEYWVYAGIDGGVEITFTSRYANRRYVFAPLPERLSASLALELAPLLGEVVVRDIAAKTPSVYRADFADLPIDFYYYPAGYRGADGKTRLEIYYGLPASEVARLRVDNQKDLLVLERGVAIYDSLWYEAHRVKDQIAFEAPTDQQVGAGAFIPGVLPVDLLPGPYYMALQVRDVLSGKSQIYRQKIYLDDYSGSDALLLSDIELAFVVVPSEAEGTFVKSGLRIIPMSSKSFRADQHAFVYFEIYNLNRDAFGQTHYRVEYTIRSHKKRSIPARILRGVGRLLRLAEKNQELTIAYEQTGDRSDEVAYVELDLTETKPGGQLVRVAVTDLLSQQETAKEITFSIVP